jgi:uncharacterized protein YceK
MILRALLLAIIFPFVALHDTIILLYDIARGIDIDDEEL